MTFWNREGEGDWGGTKSDQVIVKFVVSSNFTSWLFRFNNHLVAIFSILTMVKRVWKPTTWYSGAESVKEGGNKNIEKKEVKV